MQESKQEVIKVVSLETKVGSLPSVSNLNVDLAIV